MMPHSRYIKVTDIFGDKLLIINFYMHLKGANKLTHLRLIVYIGEEICTSAVLLTRDKIHNSVPPSFSTQLSAGDLILAVN